MLRCTDVTLEVPGRVLCRSLSVTFEPGEVWAILGRNGTGKTTLVHALAGLALPRVGRIELNGAAVAAMPARDRARQLSVLLQIEPGTWWGTVDDYVVLGRYPHAAALTAPSAADREAGRDAIKAVGMTDFADRAF